MLRRLQIFIIPMIALISLSVQAQWNPRNDGIVRRLRHHYYQLINIDMSDPRRKNTHTLTIRDMNRRNGVSLAGSSMGVANGRTLLDLIKMGHNRIESQLKVYLNPHSTQTEKANAKRQLSNTVERTRVYVNERNRLAKAIAAKIGDEEWKRNDSMKDYKPSKSVSRFMRGYEKARAKRGPARSLRSALHRETQIRAKASSRSRNLRIQSSDVPDSFL